MSEVEYNNYTEVQQKTQLNMGSPVASQCGSDTPQQTGPNPTVLKYEFKEYAKTIKLEMQQLFVFAREADHSAIGNLSRPAQKPWDDT